MGLEYKNIKAASAGFFANMFGIVGNQAGNAYAFANAKYLKWKNAAGTAVSVLGVNGSDQLVLAIKALSSVGLQFTPVDVTATADGTGTGTIADGTTMVAPTSDDANKIIVLPAPVPGSVVIILGTATGYELRSSAPATVGINGGTGADAESAVGANVALVVLCESATAWKGVQVAANGAITAIQVAA